MYVKLIELFFKNSVVVGLGAGFTFLTIISISNQQVAEWIYITGTFALIDSFINLGVYDNKIINSNSSGNICEHAYTESAAWSLIFLIGCPLVFVFNDYKSNDLFISILILFISKIINPLVMIEIANSDYFGNTEIVLKKQIISQLFSVITSLCIINFTQSYVVLAFKEIIYSILLLILIKKELRTDFSSKDTFKSISSQISMKLPLKVMKTNFPLRMSILFDTALSRSWPIFAVSIFGYDISYIAKEFSVSQQINSFLSIFSERLLYAQYARDRTFDMKLKSGFFVSTLVMIFIFISIYIFQSIEFIPLSIKELELNHIILFSILLMGMSFTKAILKVLHKFWWIVGAFVFGMLSYTSMPLVFNISIFGLVVLSYSITLLILLLGIATVLRNA